MRRKKYFYQNPYLQFILLGLMLSLLPTLAKAGLINNGLITIVGTTVIYAIASLGLNVLLGYAGLLSLGTAGFMGLAAYISAYLTQKLNVSFELSFLIAVLVPTILGLIVGLLSLKFEGIYLAIATLVVSEILREIFINVDSFTNGTSGAFASLPLFFNKLSLTRNGMYYLIIITMVIVFILIFNMTKGYLGRALNAMRGSESAAQAMGVNLFRYRLIAFGIATTLAAVSGVLYVHYVGLAYPTTWSLALSLDFLAIIVIGGLRSIYGTLLGAFIVYGMTEIFFKPIPIFASISPIFKGILLIVFILYYPNGVANIKNDVLKIYQKFMNKKEVA